MKMLDDFFGHKVRLTDERLVHILEHPEMAGMAGEIERVRGRRSWCAALARMTPCACITSSTRRHLWVANGCAPS